MKAAILAVLMCFSAVSLFCQPKDSPTKNEKTATQTTPTPTPPDGDRKSATETESAKASSPHWYTSSEWWLVMIAALTGFAIAYQAREMAKTTKVMDGQLKAINKQAEWMERQTEILVEYNKATREAADAAAKSAAATEQSVTAQQTAMSQWVTFQGWRHKARKNTEGDFVFEFNFDIVNPTSWPMTLISTILRIRGRELMTNHFVPLLPKEPYTLGMSAIVMGQEGGGYEGGMTGTPLFGAIVYLDCFGVQQSQVFSGYLSFIEGGETNFRMEYSPDNPYVKHQEKSKEAN